MNRTKVMPEMTEGIERTIEIVVKEAEMFKTVWANALELLEIRTEEMDNFGSEKGSYGIGMLDTSPHTFISDDFVTLNHRTKKVMANLRDRMVLEIFNIPDDEDEE